MKLKNIYIKKKRPQKIHGSPSQTYYLDHKMRITVITHFWVIPQFTFFPLS